MSIQLPEYIEYGPRETAPPPFTSGSGSFAGLILKGDINAIKALCDKVLNTPFAEPGPPCWQLGPFGFGRRPASQWVYEPFSDAVLLFSGRWEGLMAMPRAGMGSASEDQVSLWVPLRARNERTREESFCMMVPYMFVDNPMSLLNGREDYGYQKALARFPQSPLNAESSVTVCAFGGEFGKTSVAGWQDVMKVQRLAGIPGGGAPQPVDPGPGGEQSTAPAAEPFPVQRLIEMLERGVDQVFLKQFRDAGTPPAPAAGGPPAPARPATSISCTRAWCSWNRK